MAAGYRLSHDFFRFACAFGIAYPLKRDLPKSRERSFAVKAASTIMYASVLNVNFDVLNVNYLIVY